MNEQITGALFKRMCSTAQPSSRPTKQAINDLNVFPVPDGDTGTNMSMTIGTAVTELRKSEPATVEQAASVTASALLRGPAAIPASFSPCCSEACPRPAQGLQGGRRRGVCRRASGGCRRGV